MTRRKVLVGDRDRANYVFIFVSAITVKSVFVFVFWSRVFDPIPGMEL